MSIRFFLIYCIIHLSQISISAQEVELNQLVCKSELYYKNDTLFTGHFVTKLRDCNKSFVFQEGNIVNGKMEGKVIFKTSNAWFLGEGSYVNGKKEGFWKDVSAKHRECSEPYYQLSNGIYVLGKKEGLWKENVESSEYQEGNYKNNQREGGWKFYGYYNAKKNSYKKSYEGKYVNGKKVGEWKQWRSDGRLSEIKNYENDSLEGNYTGYEYSKKSIIHSRFIQEIGQFKNNKKVGKWKVYYWETGNLAEEGEYINGKKDMVWVHYKPDGKTLEYKEFYDEGVLIKNIVYSKNSKGEVVEFEHAKNIKTK